MNRDLSYLYYYIYSFLFKLLSNTKYNLYYIVSCVCEMSPTNALVPIG